MSIEHTLTLEDFAQKLLEEKGVSNLSQEVVDQMRNDLLERLQNFLNAELIAALSPENIEELDKRMDQNVSDNDIQTFFQEQIHDFEHVFANALLKFKSTYLG